MLERFTLWLIDKILKGDLIMMATLFASQIVMERINKNTGKSYVFADVPPKLKEQVADILISVCNLPELVPVEFGGTAA